MGLVVDWKTGKILEDGVQLALAAACVFTHYPEVEHIRSEFIWLKDNATTPAYFKRRDARDVALYLADASKLLSKHISLPLSSLSPVGYVRSIARYPTVCTMVNGTSHVSKLVGEMDLVELHRMIQSFLINNESEARSPPMWDITSSLIAERCGLPSECRPHLP